MKHDMTITRITFRALKHPDGIEPAIRIRQLLKYALRAQWLKNIDMDNGPEGKPIAPDADLDATKHEPPF
jgi:hypothetical protein